MKLSEAAAILSAAGIESARYEARALFAHYTGVSRHLLMVDDLESSDPTLIDAIKKRAERTPLQYLLGEVGFYRESYKVSPDCLIPREDTEVLVDYAVKALPTGARFIDLCTGSGCVAISVLNNTVGTTAVATDVSACALRVAEENARRIGVAERLTLFESDVLADEPPFDQLFDAILSNPPYIARSLYEGLAPEIFHEPKNAFVGGEVGDEFYRAITPKYKALLKRGGFIGFEIGYDQADALREIANNCGMSVRIINDLSGNPRVAILKNEP